MERLCAKSRNIFEPTRAEAKVSVAVSMRGELGSACHEQRSPNGWGSPSCAECGSIEEFCIPSNDHIFGALLNGSVTAALYKATLDDERPTSPSDSDGFISCDEYC